MKEKFDVTGMSCSACSSHVEKSVSNLEGIKTVSVNLLTNSMQVEYDETNLDTGQIIEAVEHAGYGASVKEYGKAAVKAGTDAGTVQLVLDNQVLAEWKVETAESIAKRDYIWCLCQLMMQFTHMNKINQ